YSPSNSMLNEVMERRLGIPLTLSIVFMELGWRVGIPFEGVGFPGHFLVRVTGAPRALLLDPYRDGRSVHGDDFRGMLRESAGGRLVLRDDHLNSISKHDMIARLLMNLKGAYLRAEDDAGAFTAVDRLLVLRPGDIEEVRDRGLLLYRLRRYGPAIRDLEHYLETRADAPDRESLEVHLRNLRRLLSSLTY